MSKAIWGGVLTGLGQGMVSQAEQMRKDALERAKMLQRTQERKEDRAAAKEDMKATQEFQLSRDETRRKYEQEEARKRRGHEANLAEIAEMDKQAAEERKRKSFSPVTVQTEDGKTVQYNEYGESRTLEGTTKPNRAPKEGFTADEMRAITLIGGDFVQEDNFGGMKITDHAGLANALRQRGQARLADKIDPQQSQPGKRYATPEAVKAALKAGEISSREEAAQILKSDFGFM